MSENKFPSSISPQTRGIGEGQGRNRVTEVLCKGQGESMKSCQPLNGNMKTSRSKLYSDPSNSRKRSPDRLTHSVTSSYSFTSFPTLSHPSFSKAQRFNKDPHKEVSKEDISAISDLDLVESNDTRKISRNLSCKRGALWFKFERIICLVISLSSRRIDTLE